jgi:quercetin dioxygenase-like cupin family protein
MATLSSLRLLLAVPEHLNSYEKLLSWRDDFPGPLTTRSIQGQLNVYPTVIDTAKLPWAPLEFPGVSMRLIHEDEESGGMTVMTRLAPGASIPAHIHSRAAETVFVISGDFIEEEVAYSPGSYFAAPAGAAHGPHGSRTGCLVLTTFSAPLDFQIVSKSTG